MHFYLWLEPCIFTVTGRSRNKIYWNESEGICWSIWLTLFTWQIMLLVLVRVNARQLLMQCKANARQVRRQRRAHCRNEYCFSHSRAHCRTPQWTQRLKQRQKFTHFLVGQFYTDNSPAANKYLKAMIKATIKAWRRLKPWWEPTVSGPGADFSVLIVGLEGCNLIKW